MQRLGIKFTVQVALCCLVILFYGCRSGADQSSVQEEPVLVEPAYASGAASWVAAGFGDMKGKSLGLVINHTARIDSMHLSDIVHASPNVTLGAMFGPEHGIRGEADAGEEISDGIDQKTGVPVYSLYGDTRKPSAASLDGLDALVFDIQDIGARFYTFISTMGLAMQAAAEAGIPFIVLDRPNPLGGEYVSGFVLEPGFESFVGAYPIPIAHGLTVGELARMIQGEGWMEGLENLDLRVMSMQGWSRSEMWPAMDQDWRPTSPNIPDYPTALVYPGMCFFEAVSANEGRGTYSPFMQVGAPWVEAARLVSALEALELPGVQFEPVSYTPRSIDGMSANPRFKDQEVHGVRLAVSNSDDYAPIETGIHVLKAFYDQAISTDEQDILNERWMGRLAGTNRLHDQLEAGKSGAEIIASWEDEVAAFRQKRAAYLLYP